MAREKIDRYSYSKVNVYHNCPYRFNLEYNEKHFVDQDTLALELGTLTHWIEEQIGICLINKQPINYDKLKEDFQNVNIPKQGKEGGIYGINILKEKYRDDFFRLNENGKSYYILCQEYLEKGIYRLEKFTKDFPDWEVNAVEQYFEVDYYCPLTAKHYLLHGYIDRILYNKKTNEYIIEDIKTRSKLFPDDDLKSPMQFFFYSYALKSMKKLGQYPDHMRYDLPFMDEKQRGGTKGWIDRCRKKLDNYLFGISQGCYQPKPSPLCYYCPFSGTNPDKGKLKIEDRYLCPYYSLWTKNGDTPCWKVAHEWEGVEKHDQILIEFQKEAKDSDFSAIEFDF